MARAVARHDARVKDLEPYDTVVLGSAVYLGAWMKDATTFLDRHEEILRGMPLWLFSSGPTAEGEGMDLAVSVKTQQRLDALGARDHHLFRAALDPKRLNILERTAIKAAESPIGDFRDWGDIERWADSIADR